MTDTCIDQRCRERLIDRAIELEPDQAEWRTNRILLTSLHGRRIGAKLTAGEALARMERDLGVLHGGDRAAVLPEVARMAVRAKEYSKAESLARELLSVLAGNQSAWYYGNGIFYGNMVLGQIALRRGDIAAAKQYLKASGRTPGSPQLNTFGPSMALAHELLKTGERGAVLDFLEACARFWEMDGGDLDRWIAEIKAGATPDFRERLDR